MDGAVTFEGGKGLIKATWSVPRGSDPLATLTITSTPTIQIRDREHGVPVTGFSAPVNVTAYDSEAAPSVSASYIFDMTGVADGIYLATFSAAVNLFDGTATVSLVKPATVQITVNAGGA